MHYGLVIYLNGYNNPVQVVIIIELAQSLHSLAVV